MWWITHRFFYTGKKQESNNKSKKYKCLQMFSVCSNSCIEQWKYKIRCTFIIHYKWKDIDFPTGLKDCKMFETNSKMVYLNILFSSYNKEEIKLAYISKSSSKYENTIIHVTKYLRFSHEQKSVKVPLVIYADTKFLLENIFICDNNLQESYTSKISNYTKCDYSLFTHHSFDNNKNKHEFNRGKTLWRSFVQI